MNNRDGQIFQKVLAEIVVLEELLDHVDEARFLSDERTARAVCMTLINIGELVKNISPELRDGHKEIPWRAIAGLRDVTAHKYQTLRKEDVYATCVTDIPVFREQIASIMKNE